MNNLIKLYEEAKVGDIVLYPTCEVCERKGNDITVTYTRGNPYAFTWKICSVNNKEKHIMIKPYRIPYYFNFLSNDDIMKKIENISKCPEKPLVVPIGNSPNKHYTIIYDKDYVEKIFISKKDKLLNKFSPIILLRNDLVAVEKYDSTTNINNEKKEIAKIWQIFPTQITNLNSIKKCHIDFENYLEQANNMKIISILEALTERTDKKDIKKYMLVLKEKNPEVIDIIIELLQDKKSKRIINKIFGALLL